MKRDADYLPTRASLLIRLQNLDDRRSWKDFFDTYWKFIFSAALKSGLTKEEAEDVVQDTLIAVARAMPDFKYEPGRGSFKGFLMTIIKRRICDLQRRKFYQANGKHFRKEELAEPSKLEDMAGEDLGVLDSQWEEEWAKNLFDVALERVKSRVRGLDFQMFVLHVVKQWPVKDVAERLGVKDSEVYTAKYKLTELITLEITKVEEKYQ